MWLLYKIFSLNTFLHDILLDLAQVATVLGRVRSTLHESHTRVPAWPALSHTRNALPTPHTRGVAQAHAVPRACATRASEAVSLAVTPVMVSVISRRFGTGIVTTREPVRVQHSAERDGAVVVLAADGRIETLRDDRQSRGNVHIDRAHEASQLGVALDLLTEVRVALERLPHRLAHGLARTRGILTDLLRWTTLFTDVADVRHLGHVSQRLLGKRSALQVAPQAADVTLHPVTGETLGSPWLVTIGAAKAVLGHVATHPLVRRELPLVQHLLWRTRRLERVINGGLSVIDGPLARPRFGLALATTLRTRVGAVRAARSNAKTHTVHAAA
jgi:hypothetical protein